MCGQIRLAAAEVKRRTCLLGLCGTREGRSSGSLYVGPTLALLLLLLLLPLPVLASGSVMLEGQLHSWTVKKLGI